LAVLHCSFRPQLSMTARYVLPARTEGPPRKPKCDRPVDTIKIFETAAGDSDIGMCSKEVSQRANRAFAHNGFWVQKIDVIRPSELVRASHRKVVAVGQSAVHGRDHKRDPGRPRICTDRLRDLTRVAAKSRRLGRLMSAARLYNGGRVYRAPRWRAIIRERSACMAK
jgi:hypothetical protein